MDGLNIEIRPVYDHYSVYIDGKFYCSADNAVEAAEEVEKYLAEHKEVNHDS